MKIIVCGSAQISDERWIGSVLSEYCQKNKVSSIVTGQQDGLEEKAVMWALGRKMKFHIVPTPKGFDENLIPKRNFTIVEKHSDAKVVLHFKGDSHSEDLCRHALDAKIPVDDVFPKH